MLVLMYLFVMNEDLYKEIIDEEFSSMTMDEMIEVLNSRNLKVLNDYACWPRTCKEIISRRFIIKRINFI